MISAMYRRHLRPATRVCAMGAVGLALSLSLTGCASRGSVGQRAAAANRPTASLLIQNNSWDRVTVYISRGGQLWRLGDVSSMAQLRVPAESAGLYADGRTTYLVAHPLAGQAFRSEPFTFPIDGEAVWTIENQASLSHVSIR